jgi:hypothetical protein
MNENKNSVESPLTSIRSCFRDVFAVRTNGLCVEAGSGPTDVKDAMSVNSSQRVNFWHALLI